MSLQASAAELEGQLGMEARAFLERGAQSARRGVSSLLAEPELLVRSPSANELLIVHPFYRWDSEDEARTHFDMRELAVEIQRNEVDVRLGARRVFWGVTESQHVVDIINQTDLLESLDLEAKLGQPMLGVSWRPSFASFEIYGLPYFRERKFKGVGTRLAPTVPVLEAEYESVQERRHVDVAGRVQFSPHESLDVAVSYFRGTNREPQLVAADRAGQIALRPYYSLIRQSALELQWIRGSLAVKSELFFRAERGPDTLRAVYGFEYTFFQLGESRKDLGLIVEHNYDSRRAHALTALQNDVFMGARLSFNDEQSSELIAGAFLDTDYESVIGKVEWQHRLGNSLTLSLDAYAFHGQKRQEPLYGSRRDGFVELGIQYHL